MLSTKYSEAAVEVLDILNHMEKEDYNKVPKKFINMLILLYQMLLKKIILGC